MLGNNMFAYCLNNPVMLLDISGEFPWIAVAGAVLGGLVNLGTSALAAKITGQSFGVWDGVVAFGVGVACTLGPIGIGTGAVVNGVYTAYSNYANGASGWAPVVSGLAAAAITIFGLGNYTQLAKSWANVGIQATFDLVFGFGANAISSTINFVSIQNTGKKAVITIDDASSLRYEHRVIGPNVYTIVQ